MARLRLQVHRYEVFMAERGYPRQRQQAKLLGLSEPTISKIRAGQEPGPRFIAGLMVQFPGVDLSYFLVAEPERGDPEPEAAE